MDAIDEHRDTIEAWAFHIMQYVNPMFRFPRGHDWNLVQAVYQQKLLELTQWEYAPNLCDEVGDALSRLNRIAYPNPTVPPMTEEQREQALERLTFRALNPEDAAEAATHITGQHIRKEQIYEWARQGRLTKHMIDDRHYRVTLRDVIHLATPRSA